MTKTTPKRTRREPTPLDAAIAHVRRTAKRLARAEAVFRAAAAKATAARDEYAAAGARVAEMAKGEPDAAQKAAGIGGEDA